MNIKLSTNQAIVVSLVLSGWLEDNMSEVQSHNPNLTPEIRDVIDQIETEILKLAVGSARPEKIVTSSYIATQDPYIRSFEQTGEAPHYAGQADSIAE